MTPDDSGRRARCHAHGPSPTEDASPAQGGASGKDGENGDAAPRPESSGFSRVASGRGASEPEEARAYWSPRRRRAARGREQRREPPAPPSDAGDENDAADPSYADDSGD
ncbi:hypothetical protein, partial [Nesterenkonia halophila]|uniref:hypothetical protein n=1 Tax=Nesterenkonia halophila TaxID=302044 RepID=UPI001B8715B7